MSAEIKIPQPIKLTPYTASPRRSRGEANNVEWYWTVRCRRQGSEGEWTLGWYTSRRVAERALAEWAASRTGKRSGRGSPTMIELLDAYDTAVQKMVSKRANTLANRRYTAGQLRGFVTEQCPDLLGEQFNAETFDSYLVWLSEKYSPQTVENALIGARTVLKWAHVSKYVGEPPKRPKFRVPPVVRSRLESDQIAAVIAAASADPDEPARMPVLLRVLSETGMRPSEAFAFRSSDINLKSAMIRVIGHSDDAYRPKTLGSHREVPISRELLDRLLALPPRDGCVFGAPEVDRVYHFWRHRFQRACHVAGVPVLTLGAFRHTRSTRLLEVGTPLHVYQRLMGHSASTALKHYAAVGTSDLRDAFERADVSHPKNGR